MLAVMIEMFVPMLSLFIFVLGTGFFSTLLAWTMTVNQAPPLAVGAMTGIYYAGLVLSSFRVERFITRVGHIRAYAAFSSTLAVICLLHGIFYSVWLWMGLRFIAGIASAGLFVVIESWLLCKSTTANRGQVLSLYMIAFYAAQSFGQFFLTIGDPQTLLLFVIASMMCSLSIIPLSMSHINSPQYTQPSTLGFKKLINKSTSGFLGCLSSGLILGGIYGLMPTFLTDLFHDKIAVAKYMFAVIFGGMLLQYPVGKLSDLIERRLVLIIISIATIVISIAIIMNYHNSWLFFLLILVFGGLTFTFYPISISHACDMLDSKDIVAGSQSLLLVYSIGAMIGPFLASAYMQALGTIGLFIYFSSVCGLVVPLLILRKTKKSNVLSEEVFQTLPQTTPLIAELDPRAENLG